MLFRKKIERSCSYCMFGATVGAGEILCTKKGLRREEDSCRRFKYDPCKRVPGKQKALDFSRYEKEDFTL